jgi:hypothetical protein
MKYLISLLFIVSFAAFGLESAYMNPQELNNDLNAINAISAGSILVGDSSGDGQEVSLSGLLDLDSSGSASLDLADGGLVASSDGLFSKGMARWTYDVSEHGGSLGSINLGVSLPPNAFLTRVYYYVDVTFTGETSGSSVSFGCEDDGNMISAKNITTLSAAGFYSGNATELSPAGSFVKDIAATCEIAANISTATQTGGKLFGWAEYGIIQ